MKETELVLHTRQNKSRPWPHLLLPRILRDGEIRAADLAHFPGAHGGMETRQGVLGNRRLRIGLMQLVARDPKYSQPAQARFNRFQNILQWLCAPAVPSPFSIPNFVARMI